MLLEGCNNLNQIVRSLGMQCPRSEATQLLPPPNHQVPVFPLRTLTFCNYREGRNAVEEVE
uniref:Uncharacterized protein n=1 Tax=Anguilla anguilla TaxID=7936 RepID=A0A0E9W8S6_ANGAN